MAGKAATLKILGNNLDAKEKLAQIKEEADQLRKDSPELKVKIDRAQASAEMAVLKSQLQGVRDAAVEAEEAIDDTADGTGRFAVVTEADLEAASQKIKATAADFEWMGVAAKESGTKAAEGTAKAAAGAEVLKKQLKSVRDEAVEAKLAVDSVGSGGGLSGLKNAFKDVDGGGLGKGLLWGGAIAATAGPGVAAMGLLAGGALALSGALVPAVVGLGLFGAVAKSGITQVEAADAANKKLTGGMGELQASVKSASKSWTSFTSDALKNGGAATMAKAIGLIPLALKDIQPVLGPVEGALDGLTAKLKKSLNSADVKGFFKFLGPEAASAIGPLGDILGHVLSIGMKVVATFGPMGDDILKVIDKLTAKADAGTNNALSKFLDWMYTNGPEIMGILKNLGTTVVNMAKAFGRLGGLDMSAFSTILNLVATISKNPIGADALVGLLVLVKVGGAIGPLVKLVMVFKDLSGVINIAKFAMIGLDAVPIIGFILLIIGVTLLLITHWNTVKKVAGDVWHWVLSVIKDAFNWVKKNWPLLLGILLGPIALAAALIFMHWHQIEDGAKTLLGKLESFFKGLPGKILSALGDLGHVLWNAGLKIIEGFLGGLEQKWTDVKNFVGGIAGWIGAHKGPISYDATLLRPHGRVIMGGLVGGLEDGMPSLTAQLTKTTNVVANTKIAGAGGSGSSADFTAEWIGGAGADQEFITWLKKNIRIRGGNPAVLGR